LNEEDAGEDAKSDDVERVFLGGERERNREADVGISITRGANIECPEERISGERTKVNW